MFNWLAQAPSGEVMVSFHRILSNLFLPGLPLGGKRKAAYGWSCWKTLDQTLFPVPKAEILSDWGSDEQSKGWCNFFLWGATFVWRVQSNSEDCSISQVSGKDKLKLTWCPEEKINWVCLEKYGQQACYSWGSFNNDAFKGVSVRTLVKRVTYPTAHWLGLVG